MAARCAGLANESDGNVYVEIVQAALDLIHGNVNSSRDVAGGKLRGRTYVDEQVSGWVILQFCDGYGGIQNFSYLGRAGVFRKGFKGTRIKSRFLACRRVRSGLRSE